ncbi:MAG: hypothetical protein ABI833_13330 [Acidobacteriota bacterium]
MSLYERYELLDLNRDIGVKTFEAREIATGRPVRVHLFVHPSAPLQAALLKAIEKLPDEERLRIIERGKHEGTPYVVTDRLVDYAGLSEWLQAVSHAVKPAKAVLETAGAWKFSAAPAKPEPTAFSPAAVSPPPPAPPPAAVSPASPQSELNQKFTDLFATAERPIVADSLLQAPPETPRNLVAPVRPPDPPRAATAAPPPVKSEPGEFTRMFQAPVAPTTAVPPSHAQTPPPAVAAPPIRTPPPAAKEPGEFTRMFQSPVGHGATPQPVVPSPSAAPPAPRSGDGEFTRFFETPSPAGPVPHSPAVQQPLTPHAAGRSGYNQVSEFTQTFGKGTMDVPPPPVAATPQREPGEFTRMFHSPGVSGPSAGGASGLPQAPASTSTPQARSQPMPPAMSGATQGFSIPTPVPSTPQPSGPGEYTRQFSAPAQLTFGQASAAPAAPLAAPSPQAFAPPAMAQPAMPNMAAAPGPARKSNLPLILGIVGIVVVAALLIIFFAMRPK